MFIPVQLDSEERRLEALSRLKILDTPPEERFDRITHKARELLKVPYAMIGFVDSERVWYKSNQGFPEPSVPRNRSFCDHSILRTEVFHVPDALEDARFAENPWVKGPPFLRMHASCPVFAPSGFAVGVLIVADTMPRILSKEETKTLMVLAGWAEEELKQAREPAETTAEGLRERCRQLQQQLDRMDLALRMLRRMAFVDDTTDFPNRRFFDQMLSQSFRRSRQEGRPLALLMVDVDFFKNYNDTYGHAEGDACLRHVARCIQRTLRKPHDFGARYGGDEFMVIANDTNETGGVRLAQRIFTQSREDPLFLPSPKHIVTISIGVAAVTPGREDIAEELVRLADEALYAAKRRGRNCVVTSTETRRERRGQKDTRPLGPLPGRTKETEGMGVPVPVRQYRDDPRRTV